MSDSGNTTKSCAAQLLQAEPLKSWTLIELGQYAEAQHEAIEQCEKDLAPAYWQLGKALNLARKNFARGHWSRFLEQWGIDKGLASKARAIHRTFKNQLQVEKMSVKEAYGKRKRLRRKRSHSSATIPSKRREHVATLGDWLVDVCQLADIYLDELAHATPEQATSFKGPIDAAVDQLQRLRQQLAHLDHATDDADMLHALEVIGTATTKSGI